ncbi:heterokaryon incompatibility protein-domain-containing protein [Paraphoma chrysanthemicola]|uniref:Heterokaryon incompatibility protein-domain-containing protein n=1 Tax=Paraphoma chrysanthemicola TaxID=798071 RepID=A0A8K0QV32_9PLEO|nr:heterokaryon incompatibility protein-domain-containing protein [Paraphoma chrysanthemicola]
MTGFPKFSTSVELFANDGDRAARIVTARPPDGDLCSLKMCDLMLDMLQECANHELCGRQNDVPLPTRLIDVESLRIIRTEGQSGRFAALSYCWGGATQTQLTTSTLASLGNHIDLGALPQSIQDAIRVARSLSIKYLWVDALCIVQDDTLDVSGQIGAMAGIYGNAYVTIVASSASCASEGFLHFRQVRKKSFNLPFRVSHQDFGIVVAQKAFISSWVRTNDYIKSIEPINERAWTLQEQMLGNRLLLYASDTLLWKCATVTGSIDQSLCMYPSSLELYSELKHSLYRDPELAVSFWRHILFDYTGRKAARITDRLPAIAALAERFEPQLGPYFAGLWERTLIKDLLWSQTSIGAELRLERKCQAPSWSWASCKGQVSTNIRFHRVTPVCTILSIERKLKNALAPYGEVCGGSVTIRSKLLSAYAIVPNSDDSNEEFFLREYYAYAVSFSDRSRPTSADSLPRTGVFRIHLDVREKTHVSGYVHLLSLSIWKAQACLVLAPAGPGLWHRIGVFHEVPKLNFEGVAEQEVTIV